jgi:hypothetical protein
MVNFTLVLNMAGAVGAAAAVALVGDVPYLGLGLAFLAGILVTFTSHYVVAVEKEPSWQKAGGKVKPSG